MRFITIEVINPCKLNSVQTYNNVPGLSINQKINLNSCKFVGIFESKIKHSNETKNRIPEIVINLLFID